MIEGMSSSPPGPMPIGAPRPPRAIRRSKPPSCASAGGKAGINHATGKSLIGAFDRPIGNDETAAPG
ncbi:MAG TPA: hypothetical protein VGO85_11955 [Caldimonas sp.]|nr:hypothetical protein [Caldimonas sp.]